MTRFAFRAIFLVLKGTVFFLGGFLFGALPLLAIVLWKILKGGVKVTMWTLGVIITGALLIVRSA